jgi:hypothetical protein
MLGFRTKVLFDGRSVGIWHPQRTSERYTCGRVTVHAEARESRLLLSPLQRFPAHHRFRTPRCVHQLGD